MRKRICSLLMALALCLTLLPAAAWAEGPDTDVPPECLCQARCTEEQRNEDCPVCGAEGALPEDCCAQETQPDTGDAQTPDTGDAQTPAPIEVSIQPTDETNAGGAPGSDGDFPSGDSEEEPTVQPEEEPTVQPEEEPTVQPEEEPTVQPECIALQAANGDVSVQDEQDEQALWLGGVNLLENPTGKGPNGGSYSYDSSTQTLTLNNYQADGTNYHTCATGFDSVYYKYYGIYLDATDFMSLNVILKGNSTLGSSSNLYYTSSFNKLDQPRTLGICGNTVIFKGSGTLNVSTQNYAINAGGIQVTESAQVKLTSYEDCLRAQSVDVEDSAKLEVDSSGNNLAYCALEINGDIAIVGEKASVKVRSNGCTYNTKYPTAMKVSGTATVSGGTLRVISDGSSDQTSCQGRALEVGSLSVKDGGRVEAYAMGKDGRTGKYDGREAIYVRTSLAVDATSSLHAETLNPDRDSYVASVNAAIQLSDNAEWKLSVFEDGELLNNTAVVTKPANGRFSQTDHTVIIRDYLQGAKEVEIRGLYHAVMVLDKNIDNKNVYYYRNSDSSAALDSTEKDEQVIDELPEKLNLRKGHSATYKSIGRLDYMGISGIEVRQGEHTLVLDQILQTRDHPYITVKSGATLNLELIDQSYLENTSGAGAIQVENGGTLNVIGGGIDTALTLSGGKNIAVKADSGAKVNFKDCVIYAEDTVIGGSGAKVNVENCWIDAVIHGDLNITSSTVNGQHMGTLTVDRVSNVNIQSVMQLGQPAKDPNGVCVYPTPITLEKLNSNANVKKESIIYRINKTTLAESLILPKISALRIRVGEELFNAKDLSIFASSNEEVAEAGKIVLWLPEGAQVENVKGFDDGSNLSVGYIYEADSGNKIITEPVYNSPGGTMRLRNLLLGKGIFALKGTVRDDNTKLCGNYQESGGNEWIDYIPAKGVKLQAETTATDFGIRVLAGSEAELQLNALRLIGPNKRVQVDKSAALTLQLMYKNAMTADGDDAVWNLTGSLTVEGLEGEKMMTLGGKHAIKGDSTARLTIDECTIISNCTDKTTPAKLASLTIKSSTVSGLGTIDCPNIIIDGGSVDLDVTPESVVRDSKGNKLAKQTFFLTGIHNQQVDDITVTGLPDGTTLSIDGVVTDSSGKLFLWLPVNANVEQVTIGGITYYPTYDGGTSTGEAPEFTEPEQDSVRILRGVDYFEFTVSVTGTPTPALQWQMSTDGGKNWTNITGKIGTSSGEYQMSREYHGAQFRCVASNGFNGDAYVEISKVFTVYYQPNLVGEGASGSSYGVKEGVPTQLSINTDALNGLTGVSVAYQWESSADGITNWVEIPGETGTSYTVCAAPGTRDLWYRCTYTLTYPNGDQIVQICPFPVSVLKRPTFQQQPQNQTAAVGKTATFSAIADGVEFFLQHHWQLSKDNGQTWEDIPGTSVGSSFSKNPKTISYTTPAVTEEMNGWQYRCVLEHNVSNCIYPADSDAAVLTVDTGHSPETYTVRFDANGGTGTMDSVTGVSGSYILPECAFSAPAGMRFKAWEIGGIEYPEGGTVSVSADTTVKAIWEIIPVAPVEYTVRFDANGGTGAIESQTTSGHRLTTLPDAVRRGYHFDGWYTESDGGVKISTDYVFSADTTVYAHWSRVGGGSSSGGGSTPTKTETTTTPDGSVTKTETKPDGTVIETTTDKDGSTGKTETKPDGSSKTEVSVSDEAVSDAKKDGSAVRLPVEVEPGDDSASASTVKIDLPNGAGETTVELPVKDVTPGTVAIIVRPDGSEEVIKDTVPTKDGIRFTVDGDVTVKIVDNARDFSDIAGHWAKDSIDFVSARELMNGTSTTTFSPDAPTTRAQLWTILARQAGVDLTGGANWYEKAQVWVKSRGISDGTNPYGIVTRAQLVTMFYRMAGSPEVTNAAVFTDVPTDSYYAGAVAWAEQRGITTGVGGGKFDPDGICTRAQIAAFLHRSYLSK